MIRKNGRSILFSCLFLLLFLFTACGATNGGNSNAGSNSNTKVTIQGTTHTQTSTPIVIMPRAVHGKAGNGPLVVTSPAPAPGGSASSAQVVLKDRMLILNSVSKQNAASAQSILITLQLTIKNTSNKPIMNQASFFLLMGSEGDAFTYQSNSSENFYGTVPALGSNSGTIVFQIPQAAASNLHLLYRPEIATEAVLLALKM